MSMMSRPIRPLAAGFALALLAACTTPAEDQRYYLPLNIEPGSGPDDTAGNEARILNSSVLVGDMLVGGIAAERLEREGNIEPATGPVVLTDDQPLDRDARRQLVFNRLAEERRTQLFDDFEQQLYFESWMSTRVDMPAMGKEDVRRAQQLLAEQGYQPGPIDGIYGPRTKAAVERFEQARGLPVTGRITTGLIDRLRFDA